MPRTHLSTDERAFDTRSVDIRELKRPPIFDDPDTYDEIVAYAERSVAEAPILREPANVATLARLLVFETMVARANQRASARMFRLIGEGVRPHAMPADTAQAMFISRRCEACSGPSISSDDRWARAWRSVKRSFELLAPRCLAGLAASALGALDEAALSWRGFRVAGRTIKLLHRSPERLRGGLYGSLSLEETGFYREINALQDGANTWEWTDGDSLITGALLPARRAGGQPHPGT